MKIWKYGIIIISISMLVLSSALVSAETIPDGQKDVLKANADGTYVRGQTMNEIDVDEITYTFSGDTLTLEYKIVGPFPQTGDYMYYAIVTTTDYSYSISMNDYGEGRTAVIPIDPNVPYDFDDPECVVGDNTLTAVFQTQGGTTVEEAFGWATFINNPIYTDWAPDNRGPEGTFGDDTPDDDTPPVDDDTTDDTTDDVTDDTTDDNTDDTTGSETLTDGQNDVMHVPGGQTGIGNQPNIDIQRITTSVDGKKFIITMELVKDGVVQSSTDYHYMFNVETSDGTEYIIQYYGGLGSAISGKGSGTVTASGNKITAEFNNVADTTVVDVSGHNNYGPNEGEAYHDYAPDSPGGAGGIGGNDGNGGIKGATKNKGIPGFEIVTIIAAIAVALILLRRKK